MTSPSMNEIMLARFEYSTAKIIKAFSGLTDKGIKNKKSRAQIKYFAMKARKQLSALLSIANAS